jgi:hypothetical protein
MHIVSRLVTGVVGLTLLGLCTPAAWAQPQPIPANLLRAGQSLYVGQMLVSQNGDFQLVLQQDGNLVLSQLSSNLVLWSSQTAGQPSYVLAMQPDGNLVLYDQATPPNVLWSSQTNGHGGAYPFGAYLLLQDDGNLIVYTEIPCWSVGTGPLCP